MPPKGVGLTTIRELAFAAAWILSSGCCTFGSRFEPGRSSRDASLFAAPPVVVHDGARATLSWTYGTDGFYFFPRYEVLDAKLVFSLQATSSTGSRTGKRGEI